MTLHFLFTVPLRDLFNELIAVFSTVFAAEIKIPQKWGNKLPIFRKLMPQNLCSRKWAKALSVHLKGIPEGGLKPL